MATNDKSKRPPRRSAATPAAPTSLPAEKITARPSAENNDPGNVSETTATRAARDLRAQRAAERAARAAAATAASGSAAAPAAPITTLTQPAPAPAAPSSNQSPPERSTAAVAPIAAAPTSSSQLPAERITPKATAAQAERITPKATPAQAERITPKATPAPERITPRPASAPERITPRPARATHSTPRPQAPEAAPTSTAERSTPPTAEPEHRIHRAVTSHSNPTMRTLPGERISPRRPGERSYGRNGEEETSAEPRTYTAAELRLEQEQRRAVELMHPGMYWYRMDLHCHTPRSTVCYREPNVSYLRILQKAEERHVDIMAFTDHNTVAGYDDLMRDRAHVEQMEREGRLTADERYRLEEYRRIFSKILVLPGFEFSATFGFHITCIFPPTTSLRRLEYLLMSMGITEEKMLLGSPEVGATTDVLNVYRTVAAEGGICIGAHANSSNGIVMNGFNFGGQTKIAYTQDPNLAALEVTDLESISRRSTPNFFNGSKPEYPRRMHCIQSSDSHLIYRDEKQRLPGMGDRTTDVLLPEQSFAALKGLLFSSDFDRVRPSRQISEAPFDAVKAARTVGPNQVQAFHDRLPMRRTSSHHILRDVVAFANTNGGTIFLGVPPLSSLPLRGVDNPAEAIDVLRGDIQRNITPALNLTMDLRTSEGKSVVLVNVPKGSDRPYALEGSQIYIRQESETNLAMRDEIVQLMREVITGGAGETIFAPRPAQIQQPQTQQPQSGERDERRFPRRERLVIAPREEQPASLPQPQIAASQLVDAVASPPTSLRQPAPQVEPALVALAAPSIAAATIAAEPDNSGGVHPEEHRQSAIGEEQASGAHHRPRRKRGRSPGQSAEAATAALVTDEPSSIEVDEPIGVEVETTSPDSITDPPHTGVEIVASEERDGTIYHTMKDLRNGNLVHHVSRHSARRLWRYAITQREHNEPRPEDVTWLGDVGLWRSTIRADVRRYDLAQRDAAGNFHAYYGVTEEGLHGPWLAFTSTTPTVENEDETAYAEQPAAAESGNREVAAETQSAMLYDPATLSNISDFADQIEQHFNRMDDPHERAMALTAHGHEHLAYPATPRRREQTAPLDETLLPASVFDEAILVPEMVSAHRAADEATLSEGLAGFEPPTYLLPEEISDFIVVLDSGDVPEAAVVSDDGTTPPLSEARAAWGVALDPEQRSRGRGGRGSGKRQPAATATEPTSATDAATTEPTSATEAIQPEPTTVPESDATVGAQSIAPETPQRQKPSRNRRPSQPKAQPEAQPASTETATAATPTRPQPARNRNRKPANQPEAQASSETPTVAPAATSEAAVVENKPARNGRRRNGPSDLRRGRDEDPANPDIAPIPQRAQRVEPYDERD